MQLLLRYDIIINNNSITYNTFIGRKMKNMKIIFEIKRFLVHDDKIFVEIIIIKKDIVRYFYSSIPDPPEVFFNDFEIKKL